MVECGWRRDRCDGRDVIVVAATTRVGLRRGRQRQTRIDESGRARVVIDEEDLVALLELALDLPARRHGLVSHGEQVEKPHQLLVVLILAVVDARVGAYALQDGRERVTRLD